MSFCSSVCARVGSKVNSVSRELPPKFKGHSTIMSWFKHLLRVGSRAPRLVGTDLAGNQYFEELTSRSTRPRRSVKLKEKQSLEQYSVESIPPEWDRWIRGLRNDPPTVQELQARVHQVEVTKQRVKNAEKKDSELREKEIEDGLVTTSQSSTRVKAVDHASAPSFKSKTETSEEPQSSGKDFQPASWKP